MQSYSEDGTKEYEVTAKGYGINPEAAEKNAILNASEQAVGLLISSETEIKSRVTDDDFSEEMMEKIKWI